MATLEGKTILIVGGSSGIGFGVAKVSLIALASHVIIASSSKTKVDDALQRLQSFFANKQIPGKFTGEVVDGKDSDSVKQLMARVGEIDHLVWTSGDALNIGTVTPDFATGKDSFDVRFWAPSVAAQAAKIRPGGSITFTSGIALLRPLAGWSLGVAVAGAIDAVTRGLAVDLAPIRVNSICPGAVLTELWDSFTEERRQLTMQNVAHMTLVKHMATPEEVAEAYLFVMKCEFITGQRVEVDGGRKFV